MTPFVSGGLQRRERRENLFLKILLLFLLPIDALLLFLLPDEVNRISHETLLWMGGAPRGAPG